MLVDRIKRPYETCPLDVGYCAGIHWFRGFWGDRLAMKVFGLQGLRLQGGKLRNAASVVISLKRRFLDRNLTKIARRLVCGNVPQKLGSRRNIESQEETSEEHKGAMLRKLSCTLQEKGGDISFCLGHLPATKPWVVRKKTDPFPSLTPDSELSPRSGILKNAWLAILLKYPSSQGCHPENIELLTIFSGRWISCCWWNQG